MRRDGGYTIGDAKLARSVYERKADGLRKPKPKKRYIVYQLQLYGWLFSEQFPDLEFDLVVYNGAGEREPVDVPDDPIELRGELERILRSNPGPRSPGNRSAGASAALRFRRLLLAAGREGEICRLCARCRPGTHAQAER